MERCVRFTDIKRSVADIQGECAENGYVVAVVELLISSCVVGTDVSALTSFTGHPVSFVEEVAARFCRSGVWLGEEVIVEWWFDDSALPFWLTLYEAVSEAMLT